MTTIPMTCLDMLQALLKIPSITEHIFQAFFWGPIQNALCLTNVRIHCRYIPGATWCKAVWNGNSRSTFKSMNHFQNRRAVSRPKIDHIISLGLAVDQMLNSQNMSFGDINHMDVISNARTVTGIVIGPEYF